MTKLVAALTAALLGTLPTTYSRVDHVALAAQTEFPFAFDVASASHVKVFVDSVPQSTGFAVALTPKAPNDTMYPGGTVTFTVAPGTGKVVRIERTVPLSQDSLWTPYSAFKAKTMEGVLDKLVTHDQQLERKTEDLDAKDAALGVKDAALQAEIDAEEVARAVAVGAEASARIAADGVLASINVAGAADPNMIAITATGGSAAIQLKDWFAFWGSNPRAYGAIPDDGLSDQAACDAAYNYAKTHGGVLNFSAGVYKCNLTITDSHITVAGAGSGSTVDGLFGGTIITGAVAAAPVLQIGNGTATVKGVSVRDLSLKGDGTYTVAGSAGNVGLKILGAGTVSVVNVELGYTGEAALDIVSGATQAVAYVNFTNFRIRDYANIGIRVRQGPVWVSTLYFANFSIAVGSGITGQTSVDSDTPVEMVNGFIQTGASGAGKLHFREATTGQFPSKGGLIGFNVGTDAAAPGDVHVILDFAKNFVGAYVRGFVRIYGLIQWQDLSTVTWNCVDTLYCRSQERMINAKIANTLAFDIKQKFDGTLYDDQAAPAMTFAGYEFANGPYLRFGGGEFITDGTINKGFGYAGATKKGQTWVNQTTGDLRFHTAIEVGADSGGQALSAIVGSLTYDSASVPANSCVQSGNLTFTGLTANNAVCAVNPGWSLEAGLMAQVFPSGVNLVNVRICNMTTAPIDPASRSFNLRCWNP
jgi:hypothetical protein